MRSYNVRVSAIAHPTVIQMKATKSNPAIALPERRVEIGNTEMYVTEIKQFIEILTNNLSDKQKLEIAQALEYEARKLRKLSDSCEDPTFHLPPIDQQLTLIDLYFCVDQPSILIEPC